MAKLAPRDGPIFRGFHNAPHIPVLRRQGRAA